MEGTDLKILVTGLGITGKSSFLRWLKSFMPLIQRTVILDLDHERDLLPETFFLGTVYVLEDVHGPTDKAAFPLKEYTLVFYLLPSWYTHFKYWRDRMTIWYENGQYAWDPDKGDHGEWCGTGRAKDWRNLPGIINYFLTHFLKRWQTIGDDFVALKTSSTLTYLVIPQGRGQEISFRFKKF
jgi:hypothetical protein